MIISHVTTLVKDACEQPTNVFGYSIWTHHIVTVVNFACELAETSGADVEIVQLAALLHDYAGISREEWIADHHTKGAELAGQILSELDYPTEKVAAVQHCIISHRASKNIPRETLEAEILASADAMAHFANVSSLLYMVYTKKGMSSDDGVEWVLSKLARSWEKLMPEAKTMIEPRYTAIKLALSTDNIIPGKE